MSADIIAAKTKKNQELAEGNERSYEELCKAAGQELGMDTGQARRETLIDCLEEWGIISQEQRLDFEIAFQEKVEEALNHYWEEFRKHTKPKLSVVKKSPKLLDQFGRPL